MTDAQIIEFASEFRAGILGDDPSNWRCGMVCFPLVTLLNMHGVECDLVETDLGDMNHIWLRLADGRALDPTIDQFNELFAETFPPVYLGMPLKYHGAEP